MTPQSFSWPLVVLALFAAGMLGLVALIMGEFRIHGILLLIGGIFIGMLLVLARMR